MLIQRSGCVNDAGCDSLLRLPWEWVSLGARCACLVFGFGSQWQARNDSTRPTPRPVIGWVTRVELRHGTQELRSYPVVVRVSPQSPAHRAGIHVGDTIVAINGRDELREYDKVQMRRGRQPNVVQVKRGARVLFIMLRLND